MNGFYALLYKRTMNEGFIKIYRKMLEWEWYSDTNTKILFIHCLLLANWEDKKWRGQIIKRGQFFSSIRHLAKALCLSAMQVRVSLDRLKVTNEITNKSQTNGTLITIVKYEDYQQVEKRNNKRITNEITNGQQTDNKRVTTTKELKEEEEEEEEEINIEFSVFWNLYNKKKGSIDNCTKKWLKLSDEEREQIIHTLPAFLLNIKEKQFQPYPETYLNQKRWEDEIEQLSVKREIKEVPHEIIGY